MNFKKDFVAIILTHGRPDKVFTFEYLKKHGYTGDVVILIDDLDKTGNEYKKKFGNLVKVFDKKKIKSESECGNNFNDLRSTIYPRNAMFGLAKELGYKYFIQLDDDYIDFRYKFDSKLNYIHRNDINSLDQVFECFVKFLDKTNITSICFAQGGDFFGGENGSLAEKVFAKRKGMNSFFCSVDRPFKFFGQMNEDVNTVIKLGSVGKIFLMTNQIALQQVATQKTSGGMTEIYLDNGTYVKSFYSVMYCPASVKISVLTSKNRRIHHKISWKSTVPMILSENIKKK
jgi:hypothetical protein